MEKKTFFFTLLIFATMILGAQTASQNIPLPQIRQNGAVKQMFVDGKPFITISGELHNYSASSIEYMKPIWSKLDSMHLLPQLADWQATGKFAGVLLLEGEENQVVQIGGYKITISKPRRSGQSTVAVSTTSSTTGAAPNPVSLMAGGVSFESRDGTGDTRPFGLVINTAPDEFLFIGSNFSPEFSIDSATGTKVAIGSNDEGRYEKGV